MLDFPTPSLAPADGLDRLRRFAGDHAGALRHAAELLGGPDGGRVAMSVLGGLAAPGPASRSLRGDVNRLRALLHLENVHAIDSVEAACFAAIEPDDPVVAEICLLADGFDEAISRSRCIAEPLRGRVVRRGQRTATVGARGVVVHPPRPFAAETRRRRRPVPRKSRSPRPTTVRAGAQ